MIDIPKCSKYIIYNTLIGNYNQNPKLSGIKQIIIKVQVPRYIII